MLQITPQHRLLLATAPIDFRRGLDGLGWPQAVASR